MRSFILSITLLFSLINYGKAQDNFFSKKYSAPEGGENLNLLNIAETPKKEYVLAGQYRIKYAGVPISYIQIIKTRSNGDTLFTHSFPGTWFLNFGQQLYIDQNRYYVSALTADSSQNFYFTNASVDSIGKNANMNQVKINDTLNFFYSQLFRLKNSDLLLSYRPQNSGLFPLNIRKYDNGGNLLWSKNYFDSLKVITRDAIINETSVIFLFQMINKDNKLQYMLAEIDNNGNLLRYKQISNGNMPQFSKLTQSKNSFFVAGRNQRELGSKNIDVVVQQLNNEWELGWSKLLYNENDNNIDQYLEDFLIDIDAIETDLIVLWKDSYLNNNIFTRFMSNGELRFTKRIDDYQFQPRSVFAAADNGIIALGTANSMAYQFVKYTMWGNLTGINKLDSKNENQLKVYPVPARSYCIVKLPKTSSYSDYIITDLNGRTIQTGILNKSTEFTIDKGNMKPGVYFLSVIGEKEILRSKIVFE